MRQIAAIFISLISFVSCTSLNQLGQSSARRVFKTNPVWVKATTEKENLGFRKINRMKPVLFKNWVIQSNGIDGIAAYDQETGNQIWRLNIENGVEGSAAIINDRLFFGAGDGQFYSVYAETGKVLWTYPIRIEGLSEPLIADGNVYFMTGNNTLYALDASNGKQLWLYSRQDPGLLSIRGGSKPAISKGTIFAGFSDGSIVALLASNGGLKWERQLNRNKKFRDIDSDPLIEGDFLYILGYDDQAYCLKTGSGDVVWKSEQGGYGSLLLSGDRLYYASNNNQMISLNKETGQKIWSYDIKKGIATSAALHKGLLIFGESQGSLTILDSGSGKKLGSFEPGRGILSPPAVQRDLDLVYFISNEANLFGVKIGWQNMDTFSYLR